jgi:prepilin-type N-terminal cleavage/methylation domain-containing protein
MSRTSTAVPARRRERGFTLAEVMTATAIFAIIFVAALMLYDRSNKVYKQGVEATDMQQGTRVAFDKLVAEIRMTGFDFDRDGTPTTSLASIWQPTYAYASGNLVQPSTPNGHTYICTTGGTSGAVEPAWDIVPNSQTTETGGSTVVWREAGELQYQQPDEQIEYAGKSVLTFRANLDYDFETGQCTGTAPCENGREQEYQSSQFPLVTTGNDEIVTYALQPVNAPATPYPSLSFFADIKKPRVVHGGTADAEEEVDLPSNIDPCDPSCSNPPYNLVRITYDEAASPAPIVTPVAENIRSVSFRYYRDIAATDEITTLPKGAGQFDADNPGAIVPERDTREEIRAIRINLVGMNPQVDTAYTHPTDTVAPHHRQYALDTLIVPRNIGRHGMREFNVTQPGAPVLHSVCPGNCEAVYLTWQAPSTGGDVDTYNILYDTDDCTSGFTYAEDAGRNLDGYAGAWITPGQQYFFAVQAINKFGANTSNCIPMMVKNKTRPEAPATVIVSGGGNAAYPEEANQITVRWTRVTENDDAMKTTTCNTGTRDVKNIPGAENIFYRVYKSTNINFQPGDPGVEEVLNEYTPTQPSFDGTHLIWTDKEAANCTTYYYRVRAVDFCARNANYNDPANVDVGISSETTPVTTGPAANGRAFEGATPPAAPVGFAISNQSCATGSCALTFAWNAVTKDDGTPTGPDIYIENYRIKVEQNILGVWGPPTVPPLAQFHDFSGGALSGTINGISEVGLYRFTVKAVDCIDGVESAAVYYPCPFTGSYDVVAGNAFGGSGVSGDPWIIESPDALGFVSSDPVQGISWEFYENGVLMSGAGGSTAGPLTSAPIPVPQLADDVPVRVSVTINVGSGCTLYAEKWMIDSAAPACALDNAASTPALFAWPSGGNDRITAVTLKNDSTQSLVIQKAIIVWNRSTSNKRAEDLSVVSFNGTNVATSCTGANGVATTMVQAPAGTTLAAGAQMPVTITFVRSNTAQAIDQRPVRDIFIVYQNPTGDVLTCQIYPGAGTGTNTSTPCQ